MENTAKRKEIHERIQEKSKQQCVEEIKRKRAENC